MTDNKLQDTVKDVGDKVSVGAKIVRVILGLFGVAPKGPKVEKLPPRK